MWYAKPTGGYASGSAEAEANVTEMAAYLFWDATPTWSIYAIAAMLGNGAGEGGLNPWRWEADQVPTYAEYQAWTPTQALSHGYGIFGFTTASRYIDNAQAQAFPGYGPNFSDRAGLATDGAAQTFFMQMEAPSNWASQSWVESYYGQVFLDELGMQVSRFNIPYSDFVAADESVSFFNLVGAFELHYEKPAAYWTNPQTGVVQHPATDSIGYRYNAARNWLQWLQEHPPGPIHRKRKGLPLWMMLNYLK